MKFLATSIGKNAWVYARKIKIKKSKERCGALTGRGTSKAARTSWLSERRLKYTCFHTLRAPGKVGGIASFSVSLWLSLRCASFYAHNSGGKQETESQCKDICSRKGTEYNIGRFLVGGAIPKINFSDQVLGVSKVHLKLEPSCDVSKNPPYLKKYPLSFCSSRDHRLFILVRTCGGFLHLARHILF